MRDGWRLQQRRWMVVLARQSNQHSSCRDSALPSFKEARVIPREFKVDRASSAFAGLSSIFCAKQSDAPTPGPPENIQAVAVLLPAMTNP